MARRTKEESLETRARILDAAEVLFQRNGVSRTSLHAIATQAGITRGAIYWHFKDKGDLFNAMMDCMTWPMEHCKHSPDYRQTIAAAPNPVARLRQHQLDALHAIVVDERLRRTLEIAIYQVELTEDMQVVRDKIFESHEDFYENNRYIFALPSVANKLRPGITPEGAARTMQSMLIGLVDTWILNPGHFDLEQTGAQAIDTILAGIGLGDWESLDLSGNPVTTT